MIQPSIHSPPRSHQVNDLPHSIRDSPTTENRNPDHRAVRVCKFRPPRRVVTDIYWVPEPILAGANRRVRRRTNVSPRTLHAKTLRTRRRRHEIDPKLRRPTLLTLNRKVGPFIGSARISRHVSENRPVRRRTNSLPNLRTHEPPFPYAGAPWGSRTRRSTSRRP